MSLFTENTQPDSESEIIIQTASLPAPALAEVEAEETAVVSTSYRSDLHTFSLMDIIGSYDGTTVADDPTIVDTSPDADVYTDKDGNILYPIDSTFGFNVLDFIGATDKTRDDLYTEGWAGDILDEDGETVGLSLHNAATDTFKSGQPLGTWAAGLGGNSVKASTEHYDVMASLLSDQAYADDPNALYALDNDLRIIDLDVDPDAGTVTEGALHGLWVEELTTALEAAIAGTDPLPEIDFDRDGIADTYSIGTVTQMHDGVEIEVAAVDLGDDGSFDVVDSWLNGFGTADVTDLLEPNESTTTYDIAVGDDYSVTLKDDGKLLYRWGTIIKRPNDIRMDIKLDLPDEWLTDDLSAINGGLGYKVTRAELVITHDITNNPNDQVRPEDYENEDATGRKPSYYIVVDPDDPTNTLWVSPVDAYGGNSDFLPSYFKLDANGAVDLTAGGTAVYDPAGELVGYRNEDAEGNFIGTVLRDMSLVDLNAAADLEFSSEDIAEGYTNEWYITMDRDPFEWSYDMYPDDPYRQVYAGFASSEAAEAAGYTEDQLVSGPRWRLGANKFGQDIPGVEIPLEDNSQPPFQHDNIGYPVGETVTTTLNLLDWAGESPLAYSGGWTAIDPDRLDENGDGVIDDGWSQVDYVGRLETDPLLGAGDALPDATITAAVTPNGQSLTPDHFDVSFYLKGDRQDSAKIYNAQLILEYDVDPLLHDVYDYGDAPDDGVTTFYQTGIDGLEQAVRAQIEPGFYLGAPVDGVEVFAADIDAETAPLTDPYALGDDDSNVDDEGNAVTFLTPLTGGAEAWVDVSASITAGGLETGYLYAWFDLDGSGTWDDDELVIAGQELGDGANVFSFDMPDYEIGALDNESVFARFILSDVEGVGPYGDTAFHGEVEDYLVRLTDAYDDVIGRDYDTWYAGLSDGDMFDTDNYGRSLYHHWDPALVADLNGDGIDDVAGYDNGEWIYGITTYTFDQAAYEADPESNYLSWRFNYDEFDGRLFTPQGEVWALDMNGDGTDEILYRNDRDRVREISLDGSYDPDNLLKLRAVYYHDVLVGDFDGDGNEELSGLKVDNQGRLDGWRLYDYDEDNNRVTKSNWKGGWKPDDYSFVVGDFNGDGMDDIAGRNSAGQWLVSLSEGDRFTKAKNWITYDKGEVLGSGDANGDGLDDLILYDAEHGQFMVGLANPDEETFAFSEFGGIPHATDWVDMRLGDFDGDGLVDVAARDAATGRWTVAESSGTAFVEDQYGVWEDDTDWQDVMVGNFDAVATILDEAPPEPVVVEDDGNGNGNGAGDGTGEGDSGSGGHQSTAPTPPDVLVQTDPDYRVRHVFSTDDIVGGYDGVTQATDASIIDFGATPNVTKDGIALYPIDSEFGFEVTDFVGAEDKVRDGVYTEGWAGDLVSETGEQLGLLVGDARTDTLQTPNLLGTWLVGMGGSAVKASTEHYTVMQQILSDQAFPGDPDAFLPLDDDLWIIDYQIGPDGMPVLDTEGNMLGDVMHGYYVKELVQALEEAGTGVAIDFDRDGVADVYTAYQADVEMDGVLRSTTVVDLGNDGSIDYFDGALNGFGTFGLADILAPNESSVLEDIAVGDDYSVTLKDDGKLLYRWGNLMKRPNDVRVNVTMELPDEWEEEDAGSGLTALYRITAAELVVNHTVTNNPNDQVRPEDFENESAIGQLPSYEVVTGDDGFIKWVSTDAYYAGDGTLYEAGTVLRDLALIDELNGSLLEYIGGTSADLEEGFTNAWYTTMDREPFVAVYDESGAYVVGPRWRLQPDKYGQDLPSVVIPIDPSDELPVRSGEEQYEVGADTTTVLNLLDWDGVSPLTLSAGWTTGAGTVSDNGLAMTTDFDMSVYIKGDINPVTLYDAELVLSYEAVEIHAADVAIGGGAGDDVLVGQGDNEFFGGLGADIFVLGYGTDTAADMGQNLVADFNIDEGDVIGLIGYGLDVDNFNIHISQALNTEFDSLELSLDGQTIALLWDVTTELEADSFYFA